MKNVTISMDEELLRATRIKAAEAGLSVSKFVAAQVEKAVKPSNENEDGLNPAQRALKKFLSGPSLDGILDENGMAPSYDERHER